MVKDWYQHLRNTGKFSINSPTLPKDKKDFPRCVVVRNREPPVVVPAYNPVHFPSRFVKVPKAAEQTAGDLTEGQDRGKDDTQAYAFTFLIHMIKSQDYKTWGYLKKSTNIPKQGLHSASKWGPKYQEIEKRFFFLVGIPDGLERQREKKKEIPPPIQGGGDFLIPLLNYWFCRGSLSLSPALS